ncbi:hypothetical protein Y032_0011g1507 [Ancylostoma ceylanicum]|uniref:Uncharacterized protein n=1 Tax=Ancylostoma ceylanicum TaxID=53326 RepID=A0A016VEB8_9BILA|nr:hypothetical protein Y032_0011g1507 [Ancylostoma ceylanicum]
MKCAPSTGFRSVMRVYSRQKTRPHFGHMENGAFIPRLPACIMLFHHFGSSPLKTSKFSKISNTKISVGAAFNKEKISN